MDVNECQIYAGTTQGCQNGATCVNTPGSYRYHAFGSLLLLPLLRAFIMVFSFYRLLLFLSFILVVIVCQSGTDPTAPLAMMTVQVAVRTCVCMGCALILTE